MATLIQRLTLNGETAGEVAISQSEMQPCCTFDLSKSRVNDAALEVLHAYKLTGNFHINLEIILKHLGAFDDVRCEIAPISKLPYHPDCRHVTFRASKNIGTDRFNEIIRCLEAGIGFDSKRWWFGSRRRRPQSPHVPDQADRARSNVAAKPANQRSVKPQLLQRPARA